MSGLFRIAARYSSGVVARLSPPDLHNGADRSCWGGRANDDGVVLLSLLPECQNESTAPVAALAVLNFLGNAMAEIIPKCKRDRVIW